MSTPKHITVTDLRTQTREILENVHFRGWRYVVERAGQPMAALVNVEEFERLAGAAQPTPGESAKSTARR